MAMNEAVIKLRDKSGCPLKLCKEALEYASTHGGDEELAMAFLRAKTLAVKTTCSFDERVQRFYDKELPCHFCDEHKGCDNCYYGQVEGKTNHPHCHDCTTTADGSLTGWESCGDNYCRKCGRKLR